MIYDILKTKKVYYIYYIIYRVYIYIHVQLQHQHDKASSVICLSCLRWHQQKTPFPRFPSVERTFTAQGGQALYHVHGQGTYQATRIGREGIEGIGRFLLLGMGGTWGIFGANGEMFNMLGKKKRRNVQEIFGNLRRSWNFSGFQCDQK